MKCEVQVEKLKRAISLTEKVAGRRTTLPVLSCVLIDIKKERAFFKATNLDLGVSVEIPVKSAWEGTFAVPARTISSFLAQISDKEQIASLEPVSKNLNITLSKSKGIFKTLPPEDFPEIPTVTGGKTSSFSSEALIKGFKSVWYSASASNVKPELSSIYMHHDAGFVVFVATDSFRLAEKKVRSQKMAEFDDILIPFKNSAEITRVLEAMGPSVTMRSSKNLASFEAGDVRITSRVIDGVFPDYKQIVPKGYTTEAVVLKQDLVNALKVSTVFSDAFNQIHLTADPKKKSFNVETKNADVGENRSEIDAALSGEPIEVNFNCKYISDSLQSIESDSISLQWNGRNKPMVMRPVSGDQTFMYLVMPMNR